LNQIQDRKNFIITAMRLKQFHTTSQDIKYIKPKISKTKDKQTNKTLKQERRMGRSVQRRYSIAGGPYL
jgi:5-bromo-4-chloroindolyl phosphate hydrolysis protein